MKRNLLELEALLVIAEMLLVTHLPVLMGISFPLWMLENY